MGKVTTENSSWLTLNGTDKSMNGAVKLWLVLNKSSCASTQDTTNPQLKLKSTNSMISSENKPRSGSVSKKTNSTVKPNASTKNGTPASNNGNCAPNKWSTLSRLNGKLAWSQENQRSQSSLSAFYGKRDHTRACLEQRLKERARCHLIQFDKFFYSAFGTNPHDLIKTLRTHYCACVMEKVQKVLDKYDYFHLYWDPRIIVNYCCTHRINIHYKVPCMRLCLNWRLCAPSLHSCVFHC